MIIAARTTLETRRVVLDERIAATAIEVVVAIAIMTLLATLSIAAIVRVRERASAARCVNNLRQMALAGHSYHASRLALPCGCRGQKTGQPSMSWMTQLLPELEQAELWDQSLRAFQAAQFFEDPPHYPLLGRRMDMFLCSTEPRTILEGRRFNVGFTCYLGVSGDNDLAFNGVLYLDSAIRMEDISDGLSTTLMIGERPPSHDGRFGWWYAGWGTPAKSGRIDLFLATAESASIYSSCPIHPQYEFGPGNDSDCDVFHFWSRHPGGANFAFCDGSVRFLSYSANPSLRALGTRASGESVTILD